jgi:hypothetical protein
MRAFVDDALHGFHLLRRDPRFVAGALGTIALGVGVNTAIFGVADALLLRPLPFKDLGRLVALWTEQGRISWPELDELRQQRTFEAVAGYSYPPNTVLRSE